MRPSYDGFIHPFPCLAVLVFLTPGLPRFAADDEASKADLFVCPLLTSIGFDLGPFLSAYQKSRYSAERNLTLSREVRFGFGFRLTLRQVYLCPSGPTRGSILLSPLLVRLSVACRQF
jgi:hypothetical protein